MGKVVPESGIPPRGARHAPVSRCPEWASRPRRPATKHRTAMPACRGGIRCFPVRWSSRAGIDMNHQKEAPRDQAGRPCYKPWDQLKPLAKIRSGPLIVKLPGLSAKKMLPEQRTRTRAIRPKGNHPECQLGVQPRWPIGSLEAAPTRPRKARVSICRLTISDHATANTNRWILRQPGNRRICGK